MGTEHRRKHTRGGGRLVATRLDAQLAERLDRVEAQLRFPASDILRIALLTLVAGVERDGALRIDIRALAAKPESGTAPELAN